MHRLNELNAFACVAFMIAALIYGYAIGNAGQDSWSAAAPLLILASCSLIAAALIKEDR